MLCSFSNPKNARKERCFFSLVSFVLNCDFHLPLFSSGMMILKNKKYLSFCPGGKSIPNPIDHRAQKEPFHLSTTRETKRDPPPVSPATTSSKKRWAKPSGVSLALSLFPRGARVWGIGDAGVFIIIIIIIIIGTITILIESDHRICVIKPRRRRCAWRATKESSISREKKRTTTTRR